MRALVQRVLHASVSVHDEVVGAIERGLLVFAGFGHDDGAREIEWMARRITGLRVFDDPAGKMNMAVNDIGGAVLAVPQFTLYGDCRRGRRPDFIAAAPPERAAQLFDQFCAVLTACGARLATGAFREHMQVSLTNDGPVTLWLECAPPVAV